MFLKEHFVDFVTCPRMSQKKSRRATTSLPAKFSTRITTNETARSPYFFGAGFAIGFFVTGFLAASLPPISVKASVALKGNARTDV